MKANAKLDSRGKLLDAWIPPDGAGDPVGCLATSFTFDAVFFEEECLGRFLRLETDANEDGPIYLLEREEKLAQLKYVAVLVDRHHCRGSRSLRWDLIPVGTPKGIFHAKISILHWQNCIRLIIGSANLTEDGYRRNQEVFTSFDFRPKSEVPKDCLLEIIKFLKNILATQSAGVSVNSINNANQFLEDLISLLGKWDLRYPGKLKIMPILVGPGRPSVIHQLQTQWPATTLPDYAHIVSPFFDKNGKAEYRPALEVWKNLLKKRGDAELNFSVVVEKLSDSDDILIHAPESLLKATPSGRRGVYTGFEEIDLESNRPLHAKTIWLESDRWVLFLIGSSNFTSPGLGLGLANIEANLVFLVDKYKQKKFHKALEATLLDGEILEIGKTTRWEQANQDGIDEASLEDPLLPPSFHSAVYGISKDGQSIQLKLDNPPKSWVLKNELTGKNWYGEREWLSEGKKKEVVIPWEGRRPPSGFWVTWKGANGKAWLPVTVESQKSLPVPEELRDLPLEVLVNILTSSRPLHRVEALRRYLRRRMDRKEEKKSITKIIDPHQKVDTSQFLLKRIRRVGWALNALRERLERPVLTLESLWWRLRGPVGVMALAGALIKESRSPEEAEFFLAELILELYRVRPQSDSGYLELKIIKEAIKGLILDLKNKISAKESRDDIVFKNYINNVLEATVD